MNDFENEHLGLIEQRESVLFEIQRVLFTGRYKMSKRHLDIFTVQSISMIYSLWEGFVQQSFQMYIQYINSLEIDFNLLSHEIVVFHMDNQYKQFYSYPSKTAGKIKFYEGLEEHFIKRYHEIYPRVDTESNVGFEVLNKLLKQFSLELFPEHWGKYTYPNASLKQTMQTFLRYRNGIAHGGDITSEEKVTREVYVKYKNLVIDLMYELHEKFMDGIKKSTYLRDN